MSERYSTEAIACGLSDVAGWLENENWIPKHVRQIRLGADRLRELEAENAVLRKALAEIEAGTILQFEESEEREVEVWMDPEDMQEIARQVLNPQQNGKA